MRAERIWFAIDPQAKDIQEVHGDDSVKIDAQNPERGKLHATAQHAVNPAGVEQHDGQEHHGAKQHDLQSEMA